MIHGIRKSTLNVIYCCSVCDVYIYINAIFLYIITYYVTYTYTSRTATALFLYIWFSERQKNVNTTAGLYYIIQNNCGFISIAVSLIGKAPFNVKMPIVCEQRLW